MAHLRLQKALQHVLFTSVGLHSCVVLQVAYGRLGPTKRDEYSILVGTPLAMQENVSLSQLLEVSMLVIDEADMVLTGSTAEPLTAHLIPQFKSRPNGPLVQVAMRRMGNCGFPACSVMEFDLSNCLRWCVVFICAVHFQRGNAA